MVGPPACSSTPVTVDSSRAVRSAAWLGEVVSSPSMWAVTSALVPSVLRNPDENGAGTAQYDSTESTPEVPRISVTICSPVFLASGASTPSGVVTSRT